MYILLRQVGKARYKEFNFFSFFFGVPHLATCIFLFFYNEPELGVGIDPGMALTPLPSSILPSSIGQGSSNPRPSDHEPSALPLDHSFRFSISKLGLNDSLKVGSPILLNLRKIEFPISKPY